MSQSKKKDRQRTNRLKKVAKRITAYSAAVAATVMTTQERSAEAEEVVWDIPDITTNVNSINFFLDTGVASTTSNFYGPNSNYGLPFSTQGRMRLVGHVNLFGSNAYIYAPTSNSGFVASAFAATYNGVNRLGAGDSVASTNDFTIGNYSGAPNNWFGTMWAGSGASSYWQPGDRGFVGIKFELADGTHFGWAEITRVSPDTQEVTLHAFGYNDTPGEPSVTPTKGGGGTFCPTSWNLFRGVLLEGDLASFCGDDDNLLKFQPGLTINSSEAPVWPEVFGNVGGGPGPSTVLSITSNVGTPGLTYTVEARNYVTGQRDVIGTQAGSFNAEQTVTYPLTADHIDSNGDVESRIGWRKTGLTINFPWEVRIDDVSWIVQ